MENKTLDKLMSNFLHLDDSIIDKISSKYFLLIISQKIRLQKDFALTQMKTLLIKFSPGPRGIHET